MTGRLCGRGLGGGGTQHDASLASVFASTSSADACQGRLEIVLDYFQSCQSDEWWEQLNISHVCQVELSPAYLFNLRERAEFHRFRTVVHS